MNMYIAKGLIEQSTDDSYNQHYASNPSILRIESLLLVSNCSTTHTITNLTS